MYSQLDCSQRIMGCPSQSDSLSYVLLCANFSTCPRHAGFSHLALGLSRSLSHHLCPLDVDHLPLLFVNLHFGSQNICLQFSCLSFHPFPHPSCSNPTAITAHLENTAPNTAFKFRIDHKLGAEEEHLLPRFSSIQPSPETAVSDRWFRYTLLFLSWHRRPQRIWICQTASKRLKYYAKMQPLWLTARAQPLSAVFALHHAPAAVLPSVPGRRGLALATAPVGALGPTGRPLCPLCPTAVHCDANTEGCHRTGQPQLMTSSSSDRDHYSLLHLSFCSLSHCVFMDFSCLAVKKKKNFANV